MSTVDPAAGRVVQGHGTAEGPSHVAGKEINPGVVHVDVRQHSGYDGTTPATKVKVDSNKPTPNPSGAPPTKPPSAVFRSPETIGLAPDRLNIICENEAQKASIAKVLESMPGAKDQYNLVVGYGRLDGAVLVSGSGGRPLHAMVGKMGESGALNLIQVGDSKDWGATSYISTCDELSGQCSKQQLSVLPVAKTVTTADVVLGHAGFEYAQRNLEQRGPHEGKHKVFGQEVQASADGFSCATVSVEDLKLLHLFKRAFPKVDDEGMPTFSRNKGMSCVPQVVASIQQEYLREVCPNAEDIPGLRNFFLSADKSARQSPEELKKMAGEIRKYLKEQNIEIEPRMLQVAKFCRGPQIVAMAGKQHVAPAMVFSDYDVFPQPGNKGLTGMESRLTELFGEKGKWQGYKKGLDEIKES